jgi:hydroxymethylglutaryl-CoA lyase
MGCYEVSLGDTTGVGTPAKTATLIGYLVQNGVPVDRLAGHFHDTYGKGAANVIQAYLCGVRAFDSSVAGLGGCPFAPGAKGNVATEDLVYMFQNAGVDTGINLSRLIDTSRWISQRLGPSHTTHIGRALASKRGAQRLSRRQHAEKSELLWLPVKETDCLQTFRSGDNVRIVLNRPRNGNALTRPVISELTAIVTTLNKDPSVSRIVLTGSGKYFCSGFEREEAYISRTRRRDMTKVAQFGHLMTLFAAIDESPKLFVACINGPAVGAGAGLAFACHFRIMIRSATVTLRETKPNMFAAIVSRYVTREWDLAFARDAILSARSISGVELSTLGLVTELVDGPKDMQPALDDLLLRLDESASETTELFRKLGRIDWSNLGEGRRRSSTATPEERVVDPDPDANFSCRGTKQEQPCDGDVGAGLHDKSKL